MQCASGGSVEKKKKDSSVGLYIRIWSRIPQLAMMAQWLKTVGR
jgi:hypothetical protein